MKPTDGKQHADLLTPKQTRLGLTWARRGLPELSKCVLKRMPTAAGDPRGFGCARGSRGQMVLAYLVRSIGFLVCMYLFRFFPERTATPLLFQLWEWEAESGNRETKMPRNCKKDGHRKKVGRKPGVCGPACTEPHPSFLSRTGLKASTQPRPRPHAGEALPPLPHLPLPTAGDCGEQGELPKPSIPPSSQPPPAEGSPGGPGGNSPAVGAASLRLLKAWCEAKSAQGIQAVLSRVGGRLCELSPSSL